ncbi:hypothetical protein LIER_29418 [Lithospermum erythrorhizon]|uniref:Reverse transcriptase domain-containing protein n=1 Tax=Lithospermum erythrorhizon TaxID=34254 RepID=A0AAV3RJ15_LITER
MEDYTRLWFRYPLRIDSHNVNRVKLGTTSVCVELDVSKPLMNETWISFVDDDDPSIVVDGFWQKVEYDDFPPYCLKYFHMSHKVDDCKRDFVKEQGKGPKAPYVHRRRKNNKEGVQINNSFAGLENVLEEEKDIAEDAKGNSMAKEVTIGKDNIHTIVQTNNNFAGLENVMEDENGEAAERRGSLRDEGGPTTVGKEHVQRNNSFAGLEIPSVDHAQRNVDGLVATGKDGVLGSLVVVDKLQVSSLSVLQDISTDFQGDMNAFCKEFKAPSATLSPKADLSMATDVTQQWSLPSEDKPGGSELQVSAEGLQEEMGALLDDIQPHCTSLGKLQKFSTPWIVVGDFNALISGEERVGGNAPDPVSMYFAQCIRDCHLLDVGFVGSKYTWTNGKLSQRLDRVLCDQAFLDTFPILNVRHLAKTASDHAPLLLELKLLHDTPKGSFRFHNMWLHHEDLNQVGFDREALHLAKAEHLRCLAIEVAYWQQKSGVKWMQDGDKSTSFFHSWVKQRRRKKAIVGTLIDGDWVSDKAKVADSVVDYFHWPLRITWLIPLWQILSTDIVCGEVFHVWIDRICACLNNCWFSVMFNGELTSFFPSSKGVRQGDPLSPTLFIIAEEYLLRGLAKLQSDHPQIAYNAGGSVRIPCLVFADDCLLFYNGLKSSLDKVNGFLAHFQSVSGQVINKDKEFLHSF